MDSILSNNGASVRESAADEALGIDLRQGRVAAPGKTGVRTDCPCWHEDPAGQALTLQVITNPNQ